MKVPIPPFTRQAIIFEKEVLELLQRIGRLQSKPLLMENQLGNFRADAFAPEGILNFKGPTIIEVRLRLLGLSAASTIKNLEAKLFHSLLTNKVTNILFITDEPVDPRTKEIIADTIIKKEIKPIYCSFSELENFYLKERNSLKGLRKKEEIKGPQEKTKDIHDSFESSDELRNAGIDIHQLYLKELKLALDNKNLSFYLGAGASAPHGFPSWKELIKELLIEGISTTAQNLDDDSLNKIIDIRLKDAGELLGGRLAKVLLKDKLKDQIQKSLYKKIVPQVESISTKVARIIKKRDFPIGIVNFNYDGMLSKELLKSGIPHDICYGTKYVPVTNSSIIYHVHGFIPEQEIDTQPHSIVFSEDDYHDSYSNSFSWQNVLHLNLMRSQTILFLGLSLRDPNLRRLLEASRKDCEKPATHYAIIKDPWIEYNNEINKILKATEEKQLADLGIKILWVNKFSEILKMLDKLI